MKTFYFFLIVMLGVNIYSQNILTIGDVFNYDIGDEFHYSTREMSYNDWSPKNYTKSIVIGKNLYDDSVVYTEHRLIYNFNYELPYTYIQYEDTIKAYFTHLDSTIKYYDPLSKMDTTNVNPSCIIYIKDTIFQSTNYLCNQIINGVEYYWECMEFGDYINYYGQGLGLVYSSSYDPGFKVSEMELLYYKKGQDECGSSYLPSSIKNISENKYSIFPNPTQNEIFIKKEGNSIDFEVRIYDLQGRLIRTVTLGSDDSKINISDLSEGAYLLKIITKQNWTTSMIIKQ